jgi:hypothetical protein
VGEEAAENWTPSWPRFTVAFMPSPSAAPFKERRVKRSQRATDAMSLLLSARAARRGSETLVVGTVDGLLIAAAKPEDAEPLAVFGALKAAGKRHEKVEAMSSCQLRHGSAHFVVTALGGAPVEGKEFESDLNRILGAPEGARTNR